MISSQAQWQRFTPRQRMIRFTWYLGMVAAVVLSLRQIEIIPEFLVDAPEQVADLFSRMWPIAWYYYPTTVHAAMMETLHIATLGTIITLFLAVPIGFLAAHNITRSTTVNYLAKLILVSSRSVNSLVWALLFVAVFGPGALAGTMAIAFRSIGFVGKLLAEALEDAQPGPIEALQAAGAPWVSVVTKGYWPQIQPAFWSIALFRWDINVRESAVLGLVGAGGIGVALESSMSLFDWDRAAMILVAIFAVVMIAEVAVTYLRKRII